MRSAIRCSIRRPRPTSRDVRGFQSVLLDLGARLGLPGMVARRRLAAVSRLRRLHRAPRARAGRRPARRLARRRRHAAGKGAPNPDAARALHRQQRLLARRAARARALLQDGQSRLPGMGAALRLRRQQPSRSCCSCIRRRCRSSAWPRRATARCSRRRNIARASRRISIRCRSGTSRSKASRPSATAFPLSAITQRPMFMYHAWGSQNAWLRQIATRNWLYLHPDTGARFGIADGDWVEVDLAPRRASRVQAKFAANVQPDTVWSWNAIGKRKRRLGLGQGCAGVEQGLPAQSSDFRHHAARRSTPTPIRSPGRRRGSTCACRSARSVAPDETRAAIRAARLRRGRRRAAALRRAHAQSRARQQDAHREERRMTSLPPPSKKKLGLVIDLDTCVGCHACAVGCKEWNAGGIAGPLTDSDPYGKEPSGVWFNRVHSYELERPAPAAARRRRNRRRRCTSRAPACIARRRPASPCARPAPATSAAKTASCWSTRTSASVAVCARGPVRMARARCRRSKAS